MRASPAAARRPSGARVPSCVPTGNGTPISESVPSSRAPGRRARLAGVTAPGSRVTLYTKPGCHLCDDARAVVARVCAELGETFDEVDILGSPDLSARYGEEIPVTLVDGAQHDFWRVDPERLRAALTRGS